MEKVSVVDRLLNSLRTSVTIKLLSILLLILILLIPSTMIISLIHERERLRDSAIEEVSSKWGGKQVLGGPVLTIPYSTQVKGSDGKTEAVIRYAHFLPDQINMNGTITPEKRYRGIYVVVLYNARLHVQGKFSYPDLDPLDIPESDFVFKDAFISIGISDMKGINDAISFMWNGARYFFNPGIVSHDIFASGVSFPVNLVKSASYAFEFDINLNGSTSINFLPFGKETIVTLSSPWASPSFEGAFLPDSRTVDDTGFKAMWKVLHLNRNYPQQGLGSFIDPGKDRAPRDMDNYSPPRETCCTAGAFGVKLLLPVDEYQKTYRSVKYCIMFVIITFLTFFFVEVLNKRRIHPIQYLLVGFAICLFYILLLSISEHLKFNPAYLISCLSILALVTFYTKHVFKNTFLTAVFSVLLALLYGFFYSLLQLEDYALLLGSLGLFIILATVMYLTRKIDWYEINKEQ